jgi:penicillin-binding protein 1C
VAGPGCALSFAESFKPGTEPRLPCTLHGEGAGPVLADSEPDVRIVSPTDGLSVLPDPEAPKGQATLALEAEVEGAPPQILWTVDAPYTARWPVTPGLHRIEARIPYTPIRSGAVRVIGR